MGEAIRVAISPQNKKKLLDATKFASVYKGLTGTVILIWLSKLETTDSRINITKDYKDRNFDDLCIILRMIYL